MPQHGHLLCFRIDLQNVVAHVIRDVEAAGPVETDAVARAACGKLDEDFADAIRSDAANRALLLVIDDEDVSVRVAGRTFDAGSELVRASQRASDKQRFFRRKDDVRRAAELRRQRDAR